MPLRLNSRFESRQRLRPPKPHRLGIQKEGREMMNRRVIKFAHVAAIGIFLVIGLAIVVGQVQKASQENSNQTNRNANDNSSANSNANSNTNTSSGMNSNTSQNMNAAKGTGSGSSLSSADQKFVTDAATGSMTKVELGVITCAPGSLQCLS